MGQRSVERTWRPGARTASAFPVRLCSPFAWDTVHPSSMFKVASTTGLEPVTPGLGNRCSVQLSYEDSSLTCISYSAVQIFTRLSRICLAQHVSQDVYVTKLRLDGRASAALNRLVHDLEHRTHISFYFPIGHIVHENCLRRKGHGSRT